MTYERVHDLMKMEFGDNPPPVDINAGEVHDVSDPPFPTTHRCLSPLLTWFFSLSLSPLFLYCLLCLFLWDSVDSHEGWCYPAHQGLDPP